MTGAPDVGNRYRLYGYPRWGSLAPQLVLEELGLDYEMVFLSREEMKSADYLKINPLGFVPSLQLPDGLCIIESSAIVQHLTNAHPDKGLAPLPGTGEHATYVQWLTFMNAEIYATANCCEYYLDAPSLSEVKAEVESKVTGLYAILESVLEANGPWLLGKRLSAADHYLFMLTFWHKPSQEALLDRMPKIARLVREIKDRPHLQACLRANQVL